MNHSEELSDRTSVHSRSPQHVVYVDMAEADATLIGVLKLVPAPKDRIWDHVEQHRLSIETKRTS